MADTESQALLEATSPEMYRNNPFRVAELPVDAGRREIRARRQRLRVMETLGAQAPASKGALALEPPPDGEAIQEAIHRLHDPEERLVDELFWFWPHKLGEGNSDQALQAIVGGDVDGALQIWRRQAAEQSEAHVSAHNMAILFHVRALDVEHARASGGAGDSGVADQREHDLGTCWEEAYRQWGALLEQEGFWTRLNGRIRDLDDPRLTSGTAHRMRKTLPVALLSINARLAARAAQDGDDAEAKRHLRVIEGSGFDEQSREAALRLAAEPIRQRITTLCEAAEAEGNADPSDAAAVARRLIDHARPLLAVLDCLFPAGHPTRDGRHDEVALRALALDIQFTNATKEWTESRELLDLVLPIAAGEAARARIEENIRIDDANAAFRTCWFCGQRAADEDAAVEVKLHGDVTHTPTLGGTQIQWRTGTVGVPRCTSCKRRADENAMLAGVATVGVLAGIVVSLVAGAFLVIFVLFIAASVIGDLLLARKWGRFTPESRAHSRARKAGGTVNDFPPIRELLEKGWALGERPSDANQ